MENKRILVVDDEADLREILEFNLESEGYDVLTASSGEEAIEILSSPENKVDLILLDIMMGGISGLKTASKIQKDLLLNIPIIFLTAKITENDLLTGFSIGADDYITKPFSLKEVLARIKAVIRRHEASSSVATESEQGSSNEKEEGVTNITLDNLYIDLNNKEVRIDGELISLTKKEYEILLVLTSSLGRTFDREEILDRVWENQVYVLERTVDVHIARLRKKLGSVGSRIVNRSGYGYIFK